MNFRNVTRKYGNKFAAVGAASVALVSPAFAALDPAVSTAVADGKADALTAGGLVIGVVVAIFALMLVKGMFSGRK